MFKGLLTKELKSPKTVLKFSGIKLGLYVFLKRMFCKMYGEMVAPFLHCSLPGPLLS